LRTLNKSTYIRKGPNQLLTIAFSTDIFPKKGYLLALQDGGLECLSTKRDGHVKYQKQG
jgi:hypothetical protein